MENCVFCKIIKGEIPAAIVYEDDFFIGFLDINPRSEGHTLIIPKIHTETLLDLPEEFASKLGLVIKGIALELVRILDAKGFNVLSNNGESAGQVVRHLHFHIIPRYEEKGHSLEVAFPVDEKAKENLQSTLSRIGRISAITYKEDISNEDNGKAEVKESKNTFNGNDEDNDKIFDEVENIPDV